MLHFNSIPPYIDNTFYTLCFLIDSSFRMSVVRPLRTPTAKTPTLQTSL